MRTTHIVIFPARSAATWGKSQKETSTTMYIRSPRNSQSCGRSLCDPSERTGLTFSGRFHGAFCLSCAVTSEQPVNQRVRSRRRLPPGSGTVEFRLGGRIRDVRVPAVGGGCGFYDAANLSGPFSDHVSRGFSGALVESRYQNSFPNSASPNSLCIASGPGRGSRFPKFSKLRQWRNA
jgi:hypothetical protein